jgi:hypothetical protein
MKKYYWHSFFIGFFGSGLLIPFAAIPGIANLFAAIVEFIERVFPSSVNAPFTTFAVLSGVCLLPLFVAYFFTPIYKKYVVSPMGLKAIAISLMFFCLGPALFYGLIALLFLASFSPQIG